MKKTFLLISLLTLFLSVSSQDKNSALRKLQMAEFAISRLYVDTVDEHKLVEEAIIEMLEQLDPHSTYNNAKEVKEMNEPLQGGFEGIGVQFQMIEDTLLIVQPVSNGPSEKVGILAGDRIIAVDDTIIAGVKMSTDEIMSRLRGPKDSKVKLTIVRRGVNEPLYFEVKRDKIPIYSLDASYMIRPQVGYIRINRFAATTSDEFLEALNKLQAQGMKDLILDLQGNGGGYLNAAIDLANEFLPQKSLIVYTEGRAARRSNFYAKGNGNFLNGKLIVLVDEYSASASEIVSGAIQDWDRGIVIGRRTFGKGLVQRPIELPDGSMIRLTVARYYTPSGRCIQKPYEKGSDGDKQYHLDLLNRYNNGELMHADSIHLPDSLKYKTKLLGRIVYGGGGIMPDYFVPIDTTHYSDYHRDLVAKGVIIKTTLNYIEKNREKLVKRYKSFHEFNEKFSIKEDILSQLREAGEKEKIPFNQEEYERALPAIISQLKALIARDLWDMSEYFQVMNETDEVVLKALKILDEMTRSEGTSVTK
ncbi:MAG: S41 family peptidase [Mediterranea massiliensis]|nr:S41 family peptidase [Mediterranea massiliensis]